MASRVMVLALVSGCAFDPSGVGSGLPRDAASGDGRSSGVIDAATGAEHLACGTASGVVGCFDFEGDLLDRSGFGNHGTAVGSPMFAPGQTGQGLVLDGVDDGVLIDDSPSLDVTELTLDLWLSLGSAGADGETRVVVDSQSQWAITVDDDQPKARCVALNGLTISGGSLANLNTFYHVACTADSTRSRLFVNGDEVACAHRTAPPPVGGNEGLALGADRSAGAALSSYFHGEIDSVRVSNVVRTPEEICAIAGRTSCTTLDEQSCSGP